jgi:hypothetical protein
MADVPRRAREIGAGRTAAFRGVAGGGPGVGGPDAERVSVFSCACGRPSCSEVLRVTAEEQRFALGEPYRFLVARGHATEIDRVVLSAGGYDVVEIRPPYRQIAEAIVEVLDD